jgi:hypothetical protein
MSVIYNILCQIAPCKALFKYSNLVCLLCVNFYSLLSCVVDSKEKLQINLGIHKVKAGHKCDIIY